MCGIWTPPAPSAAADGISAPANSLPWVLLWIIPQSRLILTLCIYIRKVQKGFCVFFQLHLPTSRPLRERRHTVPGVEKWYILVSGWKKADLDLRIFWGGGPGSPREIFAVTAAVARISRVLCACRGTWHPSRHPKPVIFLTSNWCHRDFAKTVFGSCATFV